MNEDLDRFIDVLHGIKFERYLNGSGAVSQERVDHLVSMLVGSQKARTQGGPTVYAEIAKRILEAEANWSADKGTYCGQMPPPS